MAEPGRALVVTAALTGLSRSELQGLKWDDFVGDKVNVGRAVWNGIVSDTKTLARKSSVPLLPVVVAALDAHKSRNGYNEWVFHGETRQPLRLDNYAERVIGPTLKKIGLKWHGWHSLRRGLATNLHKLGCPAKTAQAILRHAQVKTTLDFYTKVGSETSQRQMAKLGVAFKKSEKEAKRKTP